MPIVSGGVPINLEFSASTRNTDAAFAEMTKRAQELSRELDKLADMRKDREKSIKSGTSAVKDFAQSWYFIKNLAGDVLKTAQALYELGAAGAQVSRMRDSFMAIQTDGVGALEKLREASRGTIGDMDLMLAANQAKLLGVGQNVEQLSNLLEIAAFRGRAMGLSTTQAFSDMVRGIGRTSPMILDNLGIVVDADSTYTAWAEKIGKAKDELTKQDKVNALLNKTLEQGNALMKESGGLTEDAAQIYEQAAANTTNYTNLLKEQVSQALLPLVVAYNESTEAALDFESQLQLATEITGKQRWEITQLRGGQTELNQETQALVDTYLAAQEASAVYTRFLAEEKNYTEAAAEATNAYVADVEKLLGLQVDIASETQSFNDKQSENLKKQDEVKAKIAELIAQGYGPWSEKLQNLQEDYTKLGDEYSANADKHREAMNRIQYDLLITKLSVDGLTTEEKAMADAAGLFFGVVDQTAINTAANFDAVAQAVVEGKVKVDDMATALRLMEKGYKIDVVLNIIQSMGHDYTPGGYGSATQGGFATGTKGWETVPGGFPNDSYMIGLTSGEKFAVVPPGGSAGDMGGNSATVQGGGGNVNVTLVIQSAVSLADRNSLENVLMPAIEQGVRKLKAEGKFR